MTTRLLEALRDANNVENYKKIVRLFTTVGVYDGIHFILNEVQGTATIYDYVSVACPELSGAYFEIALSEVKAVNLLDRKPADPT